MIFEEGLGKLSKFLNDVRPGGCWAACIVDDVRDFAQVVECDRNHGMKAHIRLVGYFDGARKYDIGMAKDGIDSQAPRFVAHDPCGHFVGSPAVNSPVIRAAVSGIEPAGITRLVGRIVRNLRLVKVSAAGVAIPQDLVLLVMLDEEAICRYAVAVHYEAIGAGVLVPANT